MNSRIHRKKKNGNVRTNDGECDNDEVDTSQNGNDTLGKARCCSPEILSKKYKETNKLPTKTQKQNVTKKDSSINSRDDDIILTQNDDNDDDNYDDDNSLATTKVFASSEIASLFNNVNKKKSARDKTNTISAATITNAAATNIPFAYTAVHDTNPKKRSYSNGDASDDESTVAIVAKRNTEIYVHMRQHCPVYKFIDPYQEYCSKQKQSDECVQQHSNKGKTKKVPVVLYRSILNEQHRLRCLQQHTERTLLCSSNQIRSSSKTTEKMLLKNNRSEYLSNVKNSNHLCCSKCYCYVCDIPAAQCTVYWETIHCHATNSGIIGSNVWTRLRQHSRRNMRIRTNRDSGRKLQSKESRNNNLVVVDDDAESSSSDISSLNDEEEELKQQDEMIVDNSRDNENNQQPEVQQPSNDFYIQKIERWRQKQRYEEIVRQKQQRQQQNRENEHVQTNLSSPCYKRITRSCTVAAGAHTTNVAEVLLPTQQQRQEQLPTIPVEEEKESTLQYENQQPSEAIMITNATQSQVACSNDQEQIKNLSLSVRTSTISQEQVPVQLGETVKESIVVTGQTLPCDIAVLPSSSSESLTTTTTTTTTSMDQTIRSTSQEQQQQRNEELTAITISRGAGTSMSDRQTRNNVMTTTNPKNTNKKQMMKKRMVSCLESNLNDTKHCTRSTTKLRCSSNSNNNNNNGIISKQRIVPTKKAANAIDAASSIGSCLRSVKTTSTNTTTAAISTAGNGQSNKDRNSSLPPFVDTAHADDDDDENDDVDGHDDERSSSSTCSSVQIIKQTRYK